MTQPRSLATNLAVFALLVTIGAASRIVIEIPNFSAVAACALFAGWFFRRNALLALGTPILAMLISDFVLGFHHPLVMAGVYASMIVSVAFGAFVARRHDNNTRFVAIPAAALIGAVQFFIVSNFMVWAAGSLYSVDAPGLVRCYTMAVPFFKYTLASDLVFTGALFGSYAAFTAMLPAAAKNPIVKAID